MGISVQKSHQLKSIAILMMLCLHLFNRDFKDLFQPLIFIGSQPLSYYISLFSDACVPIFAFVSGYGLYYSFQNNKNIYFYKNVNRAKKLYLRYWIVLLLFAVILGWLLGKDGYPGNFLKFFVNFTGLRGSYNGAWWFFTIYIFFVFTSKFWFRILDKINPYIYLSLLFVLYVVAFYFRVYNNEIFKNPLLHYIHAQAALYFCTLFQFLLGSFALKYQWHKKVSKFFNKIKWPNLFAIIGIITLIVFHGLIPNFIIAPFTALGFIFLFLQMELGKTVEKMLNFFTVHSTNLWLIHMFIYSTFFKKLIYAPQNPMLIFVWLILWCVLASYIVNTIYSRSQKIVL
ncbi:acyltransferase [Mesonia sp. HuA40]|uniref:acyltransferase family protein n=1 Tax=Mesonia sp. HuA40 TaxID=2602761 RepID=UPI0011C7B8EE|nr:acyltransferase [Mesonia sp. HuA40]TXK75410.1 acyltransferase [Mesonia sp. HuA40]